MKRNFLITGATGTIAREMIKLMISQGICVRIGVRDVLKATQLDTAGCPVVLFDYNKPETFQEAFENINGLFLATPISIPRIDDLLIPALDTAKRMGVDQIVSLGSIGSELNHTPLSIAEKCVQSCGIDYTILRPNILMQNFGNLAGSIIKSSSLLHLPANRARVSFVDGRDVAEAAANSLMDSSLRNRIFVLTGKEALDHYQIAHILSKVSGKTVTYIPVSHNDAKMELLRAGWSEDAADIMIGLYEIARKGWCEEVRPDLAEILKREPRTFEQYAWDYRDLWV
ncbi:MAG TPA: SDR family oxidoreductase [Chitinispirillaceae bacterium]|nr:SDR family oxidoreductase [Chitinispirillaceae bacterium]